VYSHPGSVFIVENSFPRKPFASLCDVFSNAYQIRQETPVSLYITLLAYLRNKFEQKSGASRGKRVMSERRAAS
jgi:hypothetical protein